MCQEVDVTSCDENSPAATLALCKQFDFLSGEKTTTMRVKKDVTASPETTWYILEFKFFGGSSADWWWGISPEGIGSIGMLVNFAVAIPIALLTKAPPPEVQAMVEDIRVPGPTGSSAS